MTTTDEALIEQTESALWGLIKVYDARSGRGTEVFVHAPVHSVVAAVLPTIRKARADAWDEGREVGHEDGLDAAAGVSGRQRDGDTNPHRTEGDQS